MSRVHWQTYPGASGFYASAADTNLCDADTAHLHQSTTGWYASGGTVGTRSQSTDLAPVFGDYHGSASPTGAIAEAAITTISGTSGIPVSGSTEYAFSAAVSSDQPDTEGRVGLRFYDSGGSSVGSVTYSTYTAISVGAWSRFSASVTSPATAAFAAVLVTWQASSGNLAASDNLYWDASCLQSGSAGTFVPSLRVVGDLDMRVLAAADDWTPSAAADLLNWRHVASYGYALRLDTTGEFNCYAGDGSTDRIGVTPANGITNGEAAELRITLDVSTGGWTYYKDGVSFGTDTVTVNPTAYSGTASLAVGSGVGGTTYNWVGSIYSAEVRDGIDGPVVARWSGQDVWDL